MNQLAFLDAHDQAELVRKREVTPLELVDAAIARIERLNPELNAVITTMYDQARTAAAGPLPDGPFAGVPTLLKDLGAALPGVRLTSGSRFLADFVPTYESVMLSRLRGAGMLFVGKSSTPEFGLQPTTEPELFGPCRNPWDLSRTAGGSSGGAAAAVASGMVPVAHASDGGGSIRIPAAWCGLFGLKPSRGRVSTAPMGDSLGLSVWHAVTRSVRDSAALLDLVAGPVAGDPHIAPAPARPFRQEVGADPSRLRIAFSTSAPNGAPVHPACHEAVHQTARLCADLGHELVEAAPALDAELFSRSFMTLWSAMCATAIDSTAALIGRTPTPDQFEPATWAMAEMGRGVSASQYLQAVAALQLITRQVSAFFDLYDLWLTPTMPEPAPPLGTFAPTPDDPLAGVTRAADYVAFTPLANATGQPAMSVPLHWSAEGLPVGVQFMGRYGDEATLFRLAGQLEQARPWAGRIPPVHA